MREKNHWVAPVQLGDGQTLTADVLAFWDPEKISPDEVARVAAIETGRLHGQDCQPVGRASLVEAMA